MKKIAIAIDGHAGCGKSTTAKVVAQRLGYVYIDTGAMYRAVTYFLLQAGVDVQDEAAVVAQLPHIRLHFAVNPQSGQVEIYLNGAPAEQHIRSMEITQHVSTVSIIAPVRRFLVQQQQQMGQEKGMVMDGRDIGTVVFPEAELKVFMTADVRIRAARRLLELQAKGQQVDLEDVVADLQHRDLLDSTREEGPLRQAPDALVLDTSHTTLQQQIDTICDWARERMQ